jgi:hypothetical protein
MTSRIQLGIQEEEQEDELGWRWQARVDGDPTLGGRSRMVQTMPDVVSHVRNLSLSCFTNYPMAFAVFIEKGIGA